MKIASRFVLFLFICSAFVGQTRPGAIQDCLNKCAKRFCLAALSPLGGIGQNCPHEYWNCVALKCPDTDLF